MCDLELGLGLVTAARNMPENVYTSFSILNFFILSKLVICGENGSTSPNNPNEGLNK